MSDFIYYIFHVSCIFAVLYLFYRFCFSKLTFHSINRVFLLSILPLSVIIPLIDVGISSVYLSQYTLNPEVFDDFGYMGNTQQTDIVNDLHWSFGKVILIIYTLGVLALLVKMLFNVIRIASIKKRSIRFDLGEVGVLLADVPSAFSCFHWIFLPFRSINEIDSSIVEHEKLHGKLWHTMDLGLTELFVVLLWFNPFVYLFRRDLKTLHEYQIDSMILHGNIKKSDYLQLMLNNLVSSQKLVSLCNYFNGLTIKKRVKMITKENSSKWKLASYLLIFPVLALMIMSFSVPMTKNADIPGISPINKGDYDRISSPFGMRMHPTLKVEKFHNGIDFAAKKGTKIVATADGVVTNLEFKEGTYGKMIIINHGGGYETWYTQMSDYAVSKGDKVKCGDVIGYVGSSGVSTGTHLHYEVHKDGKPVDPQDYIKD